MELFATDIERFAFLLEAEAALYPFPDALIAEAVAVPQVDLTTEETPEDQRPRYVTDYIGSKQRLLDWIWRNTPDGIGSVLDAFAGSSAVGYMYKTKGMAVQANDSLRFAYHTARAIIENKDTRLTQDDLTKLLTGTTTKDFVQRTFGGMFFSKGVHKIIDTIRANIDGLPGFKRDLALCALGKTCISCRDGFGHFTARTEPRHNDTPDQFRERFAKTVARLNALVFDNGKDCRATNKDIADVLETARADLAYFDPPYATQYSSVNYEKAYHFVEGLMTYWDGVDIDPKSTVKAYAVKQATLTRQNAQEFFTGFLGKASHVPNWIISYRNNAFPTREQMRGIITDAGRNLSVKSQDHKYNLTSKNGEASYATEHLFVATKAAAGKAKADVIADALRTDAAEWVHTGGTITFNLYPIDAFQAGSLRESPAQQDGLVIPAGVAIIVGMLLETGESAVQCYIFDKAAGWDQEQAGQFIDEWSGDGSTEAAIKQGTFVAVAELQAAAVWDETPNQLRFRVRNPDDFRANSFRSKTLEGIDGVSIIVGKLKPERVPEGDNPDAMIVQSLRFVKKNDAQPDGWTGDTAKEWVDKHPDITTADDHTQPLEAAASAEGGLHTTCMIPEALLGSEADMLSPVSGNGSGTFRFVLCRTGMNKNGDFFLPEELQAHFATAINKKVDLKHSQEIPDIIGGIVAAEYREENGEGRIECVGELYLQEAPLAPLAYKLMQRQIVTQVSMECDYVQGECSICHKQVASKADYCTHLKKFKGGEYQGQPVFETLHGVTFTGVGVLDRKGADEQAKITQVASQQATQSDEGSTTTMTPEEKAAAEAAALAAAESSKKDTDADAAGKGAPGGGVPMGEQIKTLQAENDALKKENDALKKQVSDMEAKQKAADNKAKAEKLVKSLIGSGLKFGDDKAVEAEVSRLSGLSDDAYAAAEATYQQVATQLKAQAAAAPVVADDAAKAAADAQVKADADKAKADADVKTGTMKTEAGTRPADVQDSATKSFEDDLAAVIGEAWGMK